MAWYLHRESDHLKICCMFSELYKDSYKLSPDEKTYSFLNGYFMLKKDKTVADDPDNVAFRANVQTLKDTSEVKVNMPEPALPNVPAPNASPNLPDNASTTSTATPK